MEPQDQRACAKFFLTRNYHQYHKKLLLTTCSILPTFAALEIVYISQIFY